MAGNLKRAQSRKLSSQKTNSMRVDEMARRAAMLANLGFSSDQTEARLKARILWEHELVGKPIVLKQLEAVVADAYRRAGLAKKAKKKH